MARNSTKKASKQTAQAAAKAAAGGNGAPLAPTAATTLKPAPNVATVRLQPAPPRKVRVQFVLPLSDAKRLSLSGEFNGWSPDATPMERYSDGHWEATIDLAPGRYEYKYVRDGEWIPDPLAQQNVWNPHGTLNSVIEVRVENR